MLHVMSLTIFFIVLYILNIGPYITFVETVLPYGDPFTYTAGYFSLLDQLDDNYLGTIHRILVGEVNWYWLTDLFIAALSPFMVKEPFSLSLINFTMYWLASLAYFRLGRVLGATRGVSLAFGLLVWVFPINFGFSTYSSIPVMGLDSMFSGALFLALAMVLVFALQPEKKVNAILAGFVCGLAIWGRGNSLPIVGMIVFIPFMATAHGAWKCKSREITLNLILFLAILGTMTVYFYIQNLAPLMEYYSHHAKMATREAWEYERARVWVWNIPGFMFWRDEYSTATVTLTVLSHLMVPFSLLVVFFATAKKNEKLRRSLRLLVVTGAFIYVVTYAINIIFFIDSIESLYNVLLIYRPMLCGMSLMFAALLFLLCRRFNLDIGYGMIVPVLVMMWAYAMFFTYLQTPLEMARDRPSPKEVERFSLGLNSILDGGELGFLWYSYYNPQIINYYRLKNNVPDIKIYRGQYYNGMWAGLDFSDENRVRTRHEIREQFDKASVIIIPEYIESYYQHQPYPLYRFRDEVADYLNDPRSPKFVILRYLEDHADVRLVVLKKEKLAKGMGVPLPLPYGKKPLLILLDEINNGFPEKFSKENLKITQESRPSQNGKKSYRVIEGSDSNKSHSISRTFTAKASKTYKMSFLAKAAGRDTFRLQLTDMYGRSGAIINADFNNTTQLSNAGTFGKAEITHSLVEKKEFDWYKIELEAKIDEDSDKMTLQLIIGLRGGQLKYNGNGVDGLLLSSFHIE